ncbi:MAG: phosphoglycerate kinase [Kiritimatiellae bacterium]|jgi:phosphoglycerate kinase|nr:phosphoglycerate kinase [Kiritimatiellia bacterium]
MNKKTVRDVDLKNKRVLMRVDFNVPLENGRVSDDTRIRAALPTIQYVLDQGSSLVLMSHLGRPTGKPDVKFSLKPAAERLAEILGKPVGFAPDCIGPEAEAMARSLKPGEVLLLENLRFHPEEEGKPDLPKTASDEEKKAAKAEMKKKQKVFAGQLAQFGNVYVNDAFGTAHRAHASIVGVAESFRERAAGFLMEREIEYLSKATSNPAKPYAAIIGGAKISDKINVLTNLLDKVDALLIGGGMAYTFYRAKNLPVGKSLVESDKVDLARDVLAQAAQKGVQLLLPVDNIIADAFSADANTRVADENGIEEGWMALDIGPKTAQLFAAAIKNAKTIVWNGPMGCFEMAPFEDGTFAVARAIAANRGCVSIIGGGDSVSAVNKSGLADKMSHISTGGGASLEFLEGKELPGIAVLSDK